MRGTALAPPAMVMALLLAMALAIALDLAIVLTLCELELRFHSLLCLRLSHRFRLGWD